MIHYLEHKNINFQKWDDCIRRSTNPLIYGESWWLNIVCPGWDALIKGDYEAVMPLTKRKKFALEYLYQPDFTQQLGVFSDGKNDVQKFLQAVPKKFRLIEIQLNTKNTVNNFSEFELFPRKTYHLKLSEEIHVLRKSYSENTRRNLKKFEKSGYKIVSATSADDTINLFKANKGKEPGSLGVKQYTILYQLVDSAFKRKCISILNALDPFGNAVAGALFVHSNSSYIFLFSGVGKEGKENGALPAIIDHFIASHVPENKILDFEGSMIPTLARFYKSFGSEEIVYLQVRKNTLPRPLRWFK